MPHQCFNGKQVHAVFVQMGAEGMAEGMAGKPVLPAQPVLMGMDMPGEEEGVDGPVFPILLWEEVSPGLPVCKPVLCQQVKGSL